jgi:hypothetical protein
LSDEQVGVPADDAPVEDGVVVYRLVLTTWCDVIDGEWAFQSGAFDNSSGDDQDMSVVLGDTLEALHGVPGQLPDTIDWGVAALETGFLRHEESQELRRSPIPGSLELRDRAHGDVLGPKGQKRRRRLKAHAWWVIPPAAPPP